MPNNTLTMIDVVHLATIIRAAQGNATVVRLIDDMLYDGVARSICDASGMRASADRDVRDLFLRVTLMSGVDAYWPVRALMADVAAGTFVNREG